MYLARVRVATEAFVQFHIALFSARPKIDALKIKFLVVSYQFIASLSLDCLETVSFVSEACLIN